MPTTAKGKNNHVATHAHQQIRVFFEAFRKQLEAGKAGKGEKGEKRKGDKSNMAAKLKKALYVSDGRYECLTCDDKWLKPVDDEPRKHLGSNKHGVEVKKRWDGCQTSVKEGICERAAAEYSPHD